MTFTGLPALTVVPVSVAVETSGVSNPVFGS
jgi:hypothetical protein